jgi:hypothetical protein
VGIRRPRLLWPSFLTDIARFFFLSPAAGFSIQAGDGISLPGIIPQPYNAQGKRDYDPAQRTKNTLDTTHAMECIFRNDWANFTPLFQGNTF